MVYAYNLSTKDVLYIKVPSVAGQTYTLVIGPGSTAQTNCGYHLVTWWNNVADTATFRTPVTKGTGAGYYVQNQEFEIYSGGGTGICYDFSKYAVNAESGFRIAAKGDGIHIATYSDYALLESPLSVRNSVVLKYNSTATPPRFDLVSEDDGTITVLDSFEYTMDGNMHDIYLKHISSTRIQIYIDGILKLDYTGTFPRTSGYPGIGCDPALTGINAYYDNYMDFSFGNGNISAITLADGSLLVSIEALTTNSSAVYCIPISELGLSSAEDLLDISSITATLTGPSYLAVDTSYLFEVDTNLAALSVKLYKDDVYYADMVYNEISGYWEYTAIFEELNESTQFKAFIEVSTNNFTPTNSITATKLEGKYYNITESLNTVIKETGAADDAFYIILNKNTPFNALINPKRTYYLYEPWTNLDNYSGQNTESFSVSGNKLLAAPGSNDSYIKKIIALPSKFKVESAVKINTLSSNYSHLSLGDFNSENRIDLKFNTTESLLENVSGNNITDSSLVHSSLLQNFSLTYKSTLYCELVYPGSGTPIQISTNLPGYADLNAISIHAAPNLDLELSPIYISKIVDNAPTITKISENATTQVYKIEINDALSDTQITLPTNTFVLAVDEGLEILRKEINQTASISFSSSSVFFNTDQSIDLPISITMLDPSFVLNSVNLYINGTPTAATYVSDDGTTYNYTYSLSINTATTYDLYYEVNVSGILLESEHKSVIPDLEGPVFVSVSNNSELIENIPFSVFATVDDTGTGLDYVELYVNDILQGNMINLVNNDYYYAIGEYAANTYNFKLRAYDDLGNYTDSTFSIILTAAPVGPVEEGYLYKITNSKIFTPISIKKGNTVLLTVKKEAGNVSKLNGSKVFKLYHDPALGFSEIKNNVELDIDDNSTKINYFTGKDIEGDARILVKGDMIVESSANSELAGIGFFDNATEVTTANILASTYLLSSDPDVVGSLFYYNLYYSSLHNYADSTADYPLLFFNQGDVLHELLRIGKEYTFKNPLGTAIFTHPSDELPNPTVAVAAESTNDLLVIAYNYADNIEIIYKVVIDSNTVAYMLKNKSNSDIVLNVLELDIPELNLTDTDKSIKITKTELPTVALESKGVYLNDKKLNIESTVEIDQKRNTASAAKFTAVDFLNEITINKYDPVIITDGQGKTIFKGMVITVTETEETDATHYDIVALDELYGLKLDLISGSINDTANNVLNTICNKIGVTNTIEFDEDILFTKYFTEEVTYFELLKALQSHLLFDFYYHPKTNTLRTLEQDYADINNVDFITSSSKFMSDYVINRVRISNR